MPVIPATQEAEAGELLKLGGRGFGEPRSCHCTPAWATKAKLHLKKKKVNKKNKKENSQIDSFAINSSCCLVKSVFSPGPGQGHPNWFLPDFSILLSNKIFLKIINKYKDKHVACENLILPLCHCQSSLLLIHV